MHHFVPIASLNALAWTLCALAIVSTFGRLLLRFTKTKKLVWDDIFNLAALVALIGFVATYQAFFPKDYEHELYTLGLSDTAPVSEDPTFEIKLSLANIILFWMVIFLVKASFLALYWSLSKVSSSFRKAWWAVVTYTFVTFWVIFLASLWICGSPKDAVNPVACDTSSEQIIVNIESMWCALNVIGDIMIAALPLGMLRNLQMALSQKLGLAAIFAIVIIDIIFDILRTVYFNSAVLSQFPDVSAVWDLCEPSIAVIVCSLPSYRTLLSRQKSDASVPYQNMDVVPLRYSKGLPGATELDDFRAYSVGAKLITGTGFRIHNHISYQLIQLRRILPASTLMDQSS